MGISTEKVIITGARPSKGEMDGVVWDYTELYLKEHLDPEIGFGTATIPMKYGKSTNYEQFRGQTKEFQAEIDVMTVTNGRGTSKRTVTAVRFNKAPQ